MISSVARFAFILSLATMSSVAGCNSNRRLGSPTDSLSEDLIEHSHGRSLLLEDDEGHMTCGTVPGSIESRLEVAKLTNAWKAGGRKLQAIKNYTVPTVFWHTYVPGTPVEQILTKDFIINNHMVALNQGYRDTPFQFVLQDIQIIESAAYGHCERTKASEYGMKAAFKAPGKNVLNVYICDSALSDSRYWSSGPIQADIEPVYDGVVLRNYAMTPPGNKQINAIQNIVHEVGHWLGLEHTFLGGCTPKVYNGLDGKIVTGDDGVADTGAHDIPTQDVFPGADVCWIFDPPLDTCRLGGADPVRNYMNYLPGSCSKDHGEFTPGQVERMIVQHETFRLDHICRTSDITCIADSQCCPGFRCIGGSDMKMKCK